MKDTKILITGAAGLNGTALVNEFVQHQKKVRVLVRDAKKADLFNSSYVEVAVGDMLQPETLVEALKDIEIAVLISSPEPRMQETQETFIDAAKKAGVRHIVKISALNADSESPARFIRMHGEIEKYLKNSGMAWTFIRPANFMQMFLRDLPTIMHQDAFYYPMADASIAPTDAHDIAKVIYAVLTTEGHENKIYEMSGPEALTLNDIASLFSQALGRTIRYVALPPEEYRRQMLAIGIPEFLVDALNEMFSERRKGSESKVLIETHKLFNIKPTTFSEFINQNLTIFQGNQ